ncbi:MAG: DEAD/DEAH box helicase [Pyrinomonadaceae bacterium MAG19_C2-C3]|nr:DEAD/DEAH box helicase [Pyrinomonadaceae bacterium MAG19_C2-C3]
MMLRMTRTRDGKNSRSKNSSSKRHTKPRDTLKASEGTKAKTDGDGASPYPMRRRPPAVRRMLEGIGTPEPRPFKPDAFQLDALRRLEFEDVLVTAPTGSGKTWIAREEIRRLLAAGKKAWYTSPLKALTNSKYVEFSNEFGAENVGILTGDRRENSDAPLIIGTTEVFRNQLFDALRHGEDLRADLVILDEAHYLGDEERGHVWEEAIILMPARVRLLLLSATVGNAGELASWIAEVRQTKCGVVTRETQIETAHNATQHGSRTNIAPSNVAQARVVRPVPLRAGFMYPEGELTPLVDEHEHFNPDITRYLQQLKSQAGGSGRNHGAGWRTADGRHQSNVKAVLPEILSGTLIGSLGVYDLLPAIVFLPTRRRCDEAAVEAAQAVREKSESPDSRARSEARQFFLTEFAEAHPEICKHRHWNTVVRSGLAAHHAGHLPMWKVAIEEMMSRGLLDAIFATSTVAAGVDFPARTVVLSVADVRGNDGWRPLGASQFSQMTGRAGRRGKDKVGFIVVAPGRHQNPHHIFQLLHAPPEPIESQFRATYTTLLNLLDAYGSFHAVREIIERSFAFREQAARITKLETEVAAREQSITDKLRHAKLTHARLAHLRGMERLSSARTHLLEAAPHTRTEIFLRWLDETVLPGRVVSLGRSTRKLVLVTERRGAGIGGVREDGSRASFSLDRIGRVFTKIYTLTNNERLAAFDETYTGENAPLTEPRLRESRRASEDATDIINTLLERITTEAVHPQSINAHDTDTPHTSTPDAHPEASSLRAIETLWSLVAEIENITRDARRIESVRENLWQPFAHRAQVLDTLGYLDLQTERVTERGRWLADLRVDRPVLVGEALAANLFSTLDAHTFAAVVAALAADSDRSYGELAIDDALLRALTAFENTARRIAEIEWNNSIEAAPEMNYSAAAAAARWARGATWDTLVRETGAEEGDLFRMLSRTGESLTQIARLHETHPSAAERARQAARAILREPVREQ